MAQPQPQQESLEQRVIRRFNTVRMAVQALDSALVDLGQALQDLQNEYQTLKMENNRLMKEVKTKKE